MNNTLSYMVRTGAQTHITEDYVASPPALHIDDEVGIRWTLGLHAVQGVINGHFAFDVLANGRKTGEIASHIERRGGRIRIFSETGWKYWNGRSFI